MANNVYIGMRYIPNFRGEYDITTSYETLDVVDNGSGTSYIAKRNVPAGTPLSNTTYWAIYGASSGAILDLQTRMNAAETALQAIANFNTTVRPSRLAGKKIAIIGDSISDPSVNPPNWTYYFTNIITSMGGSVDNFARSGWTIGQCQTDAAGRDLTVYDLIIVFAGTNNCNYLLEDLKTEVSQMCTLLQPLRNNFVECIWITPFFSTDRGNTRALPQNVISSVIFQYARTYGIPTIDGLSFPNFSPANSMSMSDGLHPNSNIAETISTWIFNKIENYANNFNNTASYYTPFHTKITLYNGLPASGTPIPSNDYLINNANYTITADGLVYFSIAGIISNVPANMKTLGFKIDDRNIVSMIKGNFEGVPTPSCFGTVSAGYREYNSFVYTPGIDGFALFFDATDFPPQGSGLDFRVSGIGMGALNNNFIY